MKKLLAFGMVCMLLLSACGAMGETSTDIEAHDAWARAAFESGNTAVYLLVHNHSDNDDEITGTSSDAAETTEIHKSEMDANGFAQMNLQTSIPLPMDAEISFQPGGYHIMLTGLKKDLNIGDKISITLHFKVHPEMILSVPVLDVASSDHSHMDMDHTPTP